MPAYNPQHLVPPDDPSVVWCDLCGDQVQYDGEGVYLMDGIVVHVECLPEYTEGLQMRIHQIENKIASMVARGMS